ncbi:unnamed protein product [Didymodactylos carnosus]|uniref:SGNH hydrolase-type esterase domain-containing protein n=1 Tax=Didymodactylos carnosus TaxID=1234261 RepID=A0A8S2I7H8_9BILA|nr:unnamed protein product [Didymodactylos carnosus]CAF3717560.1 unnamed protein product [Didymodactylos carnosus]
MMATYSFNRIAIEYIHSIGDTSKKQVTDLVKDELVELIRRLKSKMICLEETIQHLMNDLTRSNERNSDLHVPHVSKYQATVPKQQSTSDLLDSQNSSRKPVKKKAKIHHHLLICDSLGSAIVPSDLSSPSSTTQIRTLHNKTINGATRAINNWEFDSLIKSADTITFIVGTNNLDEEPPDHAIEKMKILLDVTNKFYPRKKITVCKIPYRSKQSYRTNDIMKDVKKFNDGIDTLLFDYDNVTTFDMRLKKNMLYDGIHMNDTGYDHVIPKLRQHLEHLITSQN